MSRWLLVALMLLGFGLRLYQLDAVPLRGDEGFSALFWAGMPLADSLREIATLEPHPPLTYALFRGWALLVGIDSPFALRLLSVLTNLLGIPALYALGYRLGGTRAAWLAALFWTLHPFEIWHAQDFRNYGLWAGLSALTLYAGVRLLEGRRRGVDWGRYGGLALVTALIFYMELLVLGVLGLVALTRYRREPVFVRRFLRLQTFVVAITLAVFVALQGALFGGGGYGGTIAPLDPPALLTQFLPVLHLGETLPAPWMTLVWPLLALILAAAAVLIGRERPQQAFLLVALGMVPPLLLALISARLDVFAPRYVLAVVPAYGLLLALAGARLPRPALALSLSVGLALAGLSLNAHYHDPATLKAPNWPALTDYLTERVSADDVVIQTAVDAAFGYYYDAPALDIGLPTGPQQSRAAIVQTLATLSAQRASLWIVARTADTWPNAGIVESWAQDHLQLIRQTHADGLPIRHYKPWTVPPDTLSGAPLAIFGETVALLSVDIAPTPEPTGQWVLQAYWQPMANDDAELKTFAHLVGAINPATGTPLWSQDDLWPQGGRLDSRSWANAGVYREVYTLPMASVAPGHYELNLGFYDPATGERLLTATGADHVRVGELTLE